MDRLVLSPDENAAESVLCITTNKYLVRVLVVLLHARFSVVGPIPFLLAAIFFPGHPYIGSTTVFPDYDVIWGPKHYMRLHYAQTLYLVMVYIRTYVRILCPVMV